MYNDNKYNYHGNYDKNIKAIRGGGVITPSNPPNRSSTTGTINNTWDKNITPTPPLFESVYYSNKILTDGYLNPNNYVVHNDDISDFYFPSQNFNKVTNLKSNQILKKKYLNNSNPINLPPPLITSKYKKNKNSKSDKKDKKLKKIIDKTTDLKYIDSNENLGQDENLKHNSSKNLTKEELDLIEFIKTNALYDGKHYYVVENDDYYQNSNIKSNHKQIILPFMDITSNNLSQNNKFSNITKNNYLSDLPTLISSDTNDIENFDDNKYKENNLESSQTNTILLIIFSILLIIYFSIYQK